MRSSDKIGAVPDFIVLTWKEVRLWQSSARTTLRLAQDFYGCCCKPYGFFFYFFLFFCFGLGPCESLRSRGMLGVGNMVL